MKTTILAASALLFAVPLFFGGGAFTNDYPGHYVNNNNPGVRFDWTNHRMAVPGQGGANANENAAIIEWGDGSLVDPQGTL